MMMAARTPPSVVTKFIVQDTWNEEEDQELLAFIQSTGAALEILPAAAILRAAVEAKTMIFADTGLIQRMLGAGAVIDSYPDALAALFGRRIHQCTLADSSMPRLPFFVKKMGSDKDFAARVVHTPQDAQQCALEAGGDTVHVCEYTDFVSEHRLFLSPGRVWGMCDYSEWMVGNRLANASSSTVGSFANTTPPTSTQGMLRMEEVDVPAAFVRSVLQLCDSARLGFVVVDVGLTRSGSWCVVEANPPFALSSYDLEIGLYVEYCCAAWAWIVAARADHD